MARKSLAKRRRKRARRARNRAREAESWARWKASSRPFRRRYLVGLSFGSNKLLIDFDHSTPIPMSALDKSRPNESLEEIHGAVKRAEQVAEPKAKA